MGFDASLSVYLFICQSVSLSACYQLSDGVSLSGPLDWPVDQAPGLGDDSIFSTYCSTQYTVHGNEDEKQNKESQSGFKQVVDWKIGALVLRMFSRFLCWHNEIELTDAKFRWSERCNWSIRKKACLSQLSIKQS